VAVLAATAVYAGNLAFVVMQNTASVRAVEGGVSKLITDIYSNSLLLYGFTVVGVMVLMGLAIGFAMDFLISRLGIDLGRLERRE